MFLLSHPSHLCLLRSEFPHVVLVALNCGGAHDNCSLEALNPVPSACVHSLIPFVMSGLRVNCLVPDVMFMPVLRVCCYACI